MEKHGVRTKTGNFEKHGVRKKTGNGRKMEYIRKKATIVYLDGVGKIGR